MINSAAEDVSGGEKKRKTGFERALSASEAVGGEGGVATPFTQPHLGECDVREREREETRARERKASIHLAVVLWAHWISLMHCTAETLDLQEGDPVASK